MGRADGTLAIRTGVGISLGEHLVHLRLSGEGAYDTVDRLCPSPVHLRDGETIQTLFLDDDARCIADVWLAREDEHFVMLIDGLAPGPAVEHIGRHAADETDVLDRSRTHAVITLDGPFAWELLGKAVDQEAVGLPYGTFYKPDDDAICYRGGRTGEYGYGFVLPNDSVPDLMDRLTTAGRATGAQIVSLDSVDQCALENGYFNVRGEGRSGLTPLELQLQWRVSSRKSFVGSDAYARRRATGATQRVTTLVTDSAVSVGDAVLLEGREVGRVLNSGQSSTRGDWVALALLDIAWAHAGIGSFTIGTSAARSVAPPVINNRSMFVSAQMYTHSTQPASYPLPLRRA